MTRTLSQYLRIAEHLNNLSGEQLAKGAATASSPARWIVPAIVVLIILALLYLF
jgi:hypothetical protein